MWCGVPTRWKATGNQGPPAVLAADAFVSSYAHNKRAKKRDVAIIPAQLSPRNRDSSAQVTSPTSPTLDGPQVANNAGTGLTTSSVRIGSSSSTRPVSTSATAAGPWSVVESTQGADSRFPAHAFVPPPISPSSSAVSPLAREHLAQLSTSAVTRTYFPEVRTLKQSTAWVSLFVSLISLSVPISAEFNTDSTITTTTTTSILIRLVIIVRCALMLQVLAFSSQVAALHRESGDKWLTVWTEYQNHRAEVDALSHGASELGQPASIASPTRAPVLGPSGSAPRRRATLGNSPILPPASTPRRPKAHSMIAESDGATASPRPPRKGSHASASTPGPTSKKKLIRRATNADVNEAKTLNSTVHELLTNTEAVAAPAPASASVGAALTTDPVFSGELAHPSSLSQPPPAQALVWSPMLESYECMVELVGAFVVDVVICCERGSLCWPNLGFSSIYICDSLVPACVCLCVNSCMNAGLYSHVRVRVHVKRTQRMVWYRTNQRIACCWFKTTTL
jgi:hypothetical protein